MEKRFLFFGKQSFSGVYLLHVHLAVDQSIKFGRFNRGEPIICPAGDYVYLGSARNKALASRLLRHFRRSGDLPPHKLDGQFKQTLQDQGFPIRERQSSPKRLHWHIDHLLDSLQAEIGHVLIIRTDEKLEADLGRWLGDQSGSQIIAEGLGASDVPGSTHLLQVMGEREIFNGVKRKFTKLVEPLH